MSSSTTGQKKKAAISAGRWKKSEHEKFMKALEKHGKDWVKIQQVVKTRSLAQIRSHAQKLFLKMPEVDVQAFLAPVEESDQECRIFRKKAPQDQNRNSKCQKRIQCDSDADREKSKSSMVTAENRRVHVLRTSYIHEGSENSSKEAEVQSSDLQNYKSNMELYSSSPKLTETGNEHSLFIAALLQNQQFFCSGGNFISLIQQNVNQIQGIPKHLAYK